MEDIRKLLRDHETEIVARTARLSLRGLNSLLYDLLPDSPPYDPDKRMRHNESVHSVAFSAQLVSRMLARWLGEHVDACRGMR